VRRAVLAGIAGVRVGAEAIRAATEAEAECSRARVNRGAAVRDDLTRREQRYAAELAKRSPYDSDSIARWMRRLPPRQRPKLRRIVEECATLGRDPGIAVAVVAGQVAFVSLPRDPAGDVLRW
jgi:hypothetical protein